MPERRLGRYPHGRCLRLQPGAAPRRPPGAGTANQDPEIDLVQSVGPSRATRGNRAWTYPSPPHLTETAIRSQFDDIAANYLGVPGLIRKYFGFSNDATSVVGIYLWETKDAADAFYSDEWLSGVTERWGAAPVKQEWIVPVVAESVEGRVVGAVAR